MAETKREQDTQKRIEALLEPLLARLGFGVVLLQYQHGKRSSMVRLFIERAENHPEGGLVTVDDCAEVSREVSTLLDVEDPIPEGYELEVSSPGLNRPLVKERDFIRFAGERVKIQTAEPLDGRRNFSGALKGIEAGKVTVEVDGKTHAIPLALIARANIDYRFE